MSSKQYKGFSGYCFAICIGFSKIFSVLSETVLTANDSSEDLELYMAYGHAFLGLEKRQIGLWFNRKHQLFFYFK